MGKFDVFYNKPDYEYSNKFIRFAKAKKDIEKQNERGLFTKGIDLLAAPGRIVTGALSSMTDDTFRTNPVTSTFNVLKTANPFTDKSYDEGRYMFSDTLDNLGWKKQYNPEGRWYNPLSWNPSNTARGILGFAGDVALDPLTYLSGGGSAIGKVAKAGDKAKYASRLYSNNLTRDVAEDIISKSGFGKTINADDLIDKITRDAGIRSKETPIKFMGKEIVSSKTIDDLAESLRPITEIISDATSKVGSKISPKLKPFYDKMDANKFTDLFVNKTKREYKRLAKEDPVKAAEFLLGSMKMAKSNKKFYDEMFDFNKAANAMKQELDEVGINQSDLANYMEREDLWTINKDKRTVIDSEIEGLTQPGVKPFRAVWESSPTKPTKATWRNQDFDQPVTVVSEAGEVGGKKYFNIKGSGSAIPEDELFAKSTLADDVMETGDKLVAEGYAPNFELVGKPYGRELMSPEMSNKFKNFYKSKDSMNKSLMNRDRTRILESKLRQFKTKTDDVVDNKNIQKQAEYRDIEYKPYDVRDGIDAEQVKFRPSKLNKDITRFDIGKQDKRNMLKYIASKLFNPDNKQAVSNFVKEGMKDSMSKVRDNFLKLQRGEYIETIAKYMAGGKSLSDANYARAVNNEARKLMNKSNEELHDMFVRLAGEKNSKLTTPTIGSNFTEEILSESDEFIEKGRQKWIDEMEGLRNSKDKQPYAGFEEGELIKGTIPKHQALGQRIIEDTSYDAQADFMRNIHAIDANRKKAKINKRNKYSKAKSKPEPKPETGFELVGKPYGRDLVPQGEVQDLLPKESIIDDFKNNRDMPKIYESGYDALEDFMRADFVDFDKTNFELVGEPYEQNFVLKESAKEAKYKRYVDEFYNNTKKVAKQFDIPKIKVTKKMTEDTIDNTNWTIEMDEKVAKKLFGDNKKAQELLTKIKNDFYKWGKEEGIDDLEALILAYVPHVLEGKNMAGIFKQFSNKEFDIGKLKNEFKQGRKYKGTIDEINQRTNGMFIDNLSKLYLHRGLRHNQLVFGKHYYNDLVDMFGKRINDVDDFVKNNSQFKNSYMATQDLQKFIVDNVPKDDVAMFLKKYKLPEDLVDNFVPVTEVSFDTLKALRGIDNGIPAFALDEVVIGNINDAGKLIYDENLNAFKNIFDKVTNTFKQNVTVLSPSWYPRNAVGNYFNNFLNVGTTIFDKDIDDIASMIVRFKNRDPNKVSTALSNDVITKTFKTKDGKEYTIQQIIDMVDDYGVISQGSFQEVSKEMGQGVVDATGRSVAQDPNRYNPLSTIFDIGDIKGSIKKSPKQMRHEQFGVAKTMGEFGSKIEDKAKIQNFLANLKQGKNPFESADNVKKYLFDYGELSKFERDYMKRIIPFYTWIRKNTPLQLESLLNQPGLYMGLEHGRENIEEYTDDRIPYDQRQAYKQLGIQLPGGEGMTLNNMLPISDLGMIPNPSTDYFRDAGGTLNPIISSPIEALLNKDMFFGDEVGDAGERLKKIPKSLLPTYFRQMQYLDSDVDSDKKARNLLKDISGISLTK